jgi:glycosyltransferase involved in cell wall biosynthesis
LAELPAFVLRAGRALRTAGPFDRVVAHFIVPSGWPIAVSLHAPLEVRAHGADVRLLAAMPRAISGRIVASLLGRGARFVFAASSLRTQLVDALPSRVAADLEAASAVELPPLEMPCPSDLPAPWRERGVARPYAVWVGRLVPEKRPALAARAALAAGVPLVVVGDGPEALPPGVIRVGRVPRDVALGWIAGAQVLVSTSRDEAAPSTVREARLLGVPVVATPAGDIREWSRADAGIVVVATLAELVAALKAAVAAPACVGADRRW